MLHSPSQIIQHIPPDCGFVGFIRTGDIGKTYFYLRKGYARGCPKLNRYRVGRVQYVYIPGNFDNADYLVVKAPIGLFDGSYSVGGGPRVATVYGFVISSFITA